jgi:ATP-dependent Clp protease adaptor protein ClpS
MKKEELRNKVLLKKNKNKFILILFNDEVNSIDYVIRSLVEICGHDDIQAEQCALITHFKGSCEIKIGSRTILQSMSRRLKGKGLSSRVESC